MKAIMTIILLAALSISQAQTLIINEETSDVTFETRHLLGNLQGTIKGVYGTAFIDSTNLASSFLNLSFVTSTILHDDMYVGPNLYKEECLDIKRNPTIDLRSGSISKIKGKNQYQFKGALIVKGKSRELTFPFYAIPNIGGYDFAFRFPMAKKPYELHCSFCKKINITVKAYGKRKIAELPS